MIFKWAHAFSWVLAAALPAAGAVPDEDRVRAELGSIFELPEFKPLSQNEIDWSPLVDLSRYLARLHANAPILYWLIIVALIATVVALVGFAAWRVKRAVFVGRSTTVNREPSIARRAESARLRRRADEHAHLGEYTAAVRCLFLSLVYAFDEAERLTFHPAVTNREYLREFRDQPPLHERLKRLVDLLDLNWYGEHDTTPEQYQNCIVLYDQLMRQA